MACFCALASYHIRALQSLNTFSLSLFPLLTLYFFFLSLSLPQAISSFLSITSAAITLVWELHGVSVVVAAVAVAVASTSYLAVAFVFSSSSVV